MPATSEKQRRKMFALRARGEITQKQLENYVEPVKGKKLPMYAKKRKKR